ncbi:MAG: hypothetical protein JXR37_09680 [Kiritimatiellae bacterium]|nr:hypothetical protein [Kiritimatiellia bacterium]
MSAVNEVIVREYFEWLGYLVTQPRKYVGPRTKTAEEEADLIVFNPLVSEQKMPDAIVWTASSFRHVARAVVGVRGWHTETFYAGVLEQSPEIFRFADEDVVGIAARRLGSRNVAKVLCLPQLPASGHLKKKAIQVLKDRGIDGVLSFRTILLELMQGVDTHKNYEKSDLLQVIRILKNYDLLKDSQLDLFGKRRRVKRGAAKKQDSESGESA